MTPDLFPATAVPRLGRRHNIAVGTCSWIDPSLIKAGTFYPRGCSSAQARLRHYASVFPVVEVDSSYYAMPSARNSALWVERTPAEFRFNVKAFRLLTGHQTAPASFPPDLQAELPPLRGGRKNHYYAEVPEAVRQELWRRFIEAIAPLRDAGKLTAVHFQFAPWVTTSPEWLRHIEHCVQAMAGHRVALEFRNRLWLDAARVEQTLAWLRRLGAVHVVVDEPQGVDHCAQAVWETTHPALAIVRLHGRNAATWNTKGLAAASDRFNYEYPDDELQDLAERSAALAERAFEVQVLVNVNHEDQGVRAARRLQDLLARLAAPR